jgi:hypothetical protein
VAQNTCSTTPVSQQCGDDGFDPSTDSADANECIAFKGLNLSMGIKSRFMPHLVNNQKNVWITDEPITEPITGHGKLIVIYSGQTGRGSIVKIDGWKGKIILCGFVVDQIKRVRGKLALINSSVKKMEYSKGRVVANFIQNLNGSLKIASAAISGGQAKAGVFAINNATISNLGDWTSMTAEPIKLKSDLAKLQKATLADHDLALAGLKQQITSLELADKKKNQVAIAKLNVKMTELKNVIKDLLKLKIKFESSDDDHDCDQDATKVYEIDLLKKWKEFTEKAKNKAKECQAEGKGLFETVKATVGSFLANFK